MQNTFFNKEMISAITTLIEKYDLDARFLLGKRPTGWTDVQHQLYSTPECYIVPARANPAYHLGMHATTLCNDDGVVVETTNREGPLTISQDTIPIDYDCVICIQVRGIKANKEPRSIHVTCTDPNWESRLAKDLSRLEPVTMPTLTIYNWASISDAVTY